MGLANMLPRAGLNAFYAVTGRGGDWLKHKEQYHDRRGAMEREFLRSAEAEPAKVLRRPCPACGSAEVASSFASPVGFHFDVCALDGMIYMNPCPTNESLSGLYNHAASSFRWVGEKSEPEARVTPGGRDDYDALVRLVPRELLGGKLLAVGCSNGRFLLTAREGFQVEGVELNDTTASVARRQGLTVTSGRLSDLPGENRYDVITMLQVIEHIVDVEKEVREVQRLLKPGGVLYLNTPAVDSTSFELLREQHTHVSGFGHVSLFTRAAMSRLADRCGLDVVAHEDCGGLDLSLADLFTRAVSRDRFRHRMAMYSSRLYYGFELIEQSTLGRGIKRLVVPGERQSYQRAVLRKR